MTVRHENLLKLLAGVLIAALPALFGYCKAREETELAAREADAGYKALVTSVAHLQELVAAQQKTLDTLVRGFGLGPFAAPAPTAAFPDLPADTAAALQQQQAAD